MSSENSILSETKNPPSEGSEALANAIYISDKAKVKIHQLMKDAGVEADPSYFVRVGVVGGGCSGLSY